MQNLLRILLRYSNFLVFLFLEVAAFLLISWSNSYPRSAMLSTANDFIAWQHEQISEMRGYLSLRSQNEQLAAENVALRNQLCRMDSSRNSGSFHYGSAKVVQMTTDQLHNFITINRGSRDGIVRGQGVRNEDGVIGMIRTVGPNYSVVQPIINTESHLSCRFAKNDYLGTLTWDGKDNRFAILTDVSTHMVVNPGDTIVSSGLSPAFPEGIPVGIVENSVLKSGDSYYTIHVRLSTNFKRLKYVEVVQNADQKELEDVIYGMD
jgi:rod shape-determining protein MreC